MVEDLIFETEKRKNEKLKSVNGKIKIKRNFPQDTDSTQTRPVFAGRQKRLGSIEIFLAFYVPNLLTLTR